MSAINPPLVLVVDDDAAVAKTVGGLLRQAGIDAEVTDSAAGALQALARRPIDVVLTDLRMPTMDGLDLLSRVRGEWPDIPVVLLTAHGSVPLAVEAMRRGAFDFILKPFDRDELLVVVRKALASARHAQRAEPSTPLAGTTLSGDGSPAVVPGASGAMREVEDQLRRAARSNATVLLRGDSGTGKEVAARQLHALSPRRDGPLVVVHAAALPETLLESELFGHEKGAFTGAAARKPGRVELAAGGTLFLDEVGDIPPAIQVKLLRLICEREYQRVGGNQTLHADVRFVAATHRDLEKMVAEERFREDLLFRLSVIEIRLPPLRERREDVAALATTFCAELGRENGRPEVRFDQAAIALLEAQPWPGNIRQLRNFIERLVVMSDDEVLGAEQVRRELSRRSAALPSTPPSPAPTPPGARPATAVEDGAGGAATLGEQRRETERSAIVEALQRSGNNRSRAARILGVGRRTLYNKLRELGID